jgi:hypothetical protein
VEAVVLAVLVSPQLFLGHRLLALVEAAAV